MFIASKICDFVNNENKPNWWRFVVSKAMECRDLSSIEFEQAYLIAKMEFGLEPKSVDYQSLIKPVEAIGYDEEIEEIRLISIGNISNISTLVQNNRVDFSKNGLTVIYGNNGSGKSSYAKMLKNACLTRGEPPKLRANIFEETVGIPSAEFHIESNGLPEIIKWNNELESHPSLKSIRVFDSSSSGHYLSKGDTLDFKPTSLKLLDELLKASAFIMERAKEEEKNYSPISVLPKMNTNTEPSKLVINASLDSKIVDLLCATQDEEVELKALRIEVFELENNTPEKIREKYKSRRLRLLPFRIFLTNLIRELGSEKIRINQDLYNTKVQKKLIADSLSKQTFSELPISEIGSEQWTTMWASIKKFVECLNHNNIFPPIEGSHCPACLQRIDSTTATRLLSFEDYLHNEFHKDAKTALDMWNKSLVKIKELNFSTEPYKAILDEIQGKDERLGLLFYELIDHLSKRAEKILKGDPPFDFFDLNLEPLTRLNSYIKKLEEYENTLLDDIKKAQVISFKKQKILEIEDRIKILSVKDLIKNEIKKANKIQLFNDLKKSTYTTTITLLSNEITSSGSIGKLQEFFDQELVKLGFNHFNVATITKGIKGTQVFSLGLSGKEVSIPDIASEGEQKCISLAGFFAELTADNRNSAIIFDDPVNSLDHIWRYKFSKRIAEEADKRQVIVLTHDLPFLKMLQEVTTHIQVKAITRDKKVTGIPLDSPPWDALKTADRIGKLKVKVVQAKKFSENSIEEYQSYASIIYGEKRETWERLVEEWLLRNVVERFSREIKTQNTRYLTDITDIDVQKISDAMSKCSTYMIGHDMAEAMSGSFPDIAELESDLNGLDIYFKELKKRRS